MNGIDAYFENLKRVLSNALTAQRDNMEQAASLLADTVADGGSIYAFGCSHAGLLACATRALPTTSRWAALSTFMRNGTRRCR